MVTSERVSNHTVDDVSKFTRISTDLRVYELNYIEVGYNSENDIL
jgi:hypothetical protein